MEDDAEVLEEAPVTAVPPSEDDGGDDERRLKKQRSEGASESESMEGETSLEHRRQLQDLLEEAGQVEGEDGRAEAVDVGERGSRLERLHLVHRRLGHPSNENLRRMLEMAGADDGLLKMASELRCPLCQLRSAPRRPHPARPEARPVHFNSVIHIDLKYQHDHKGTTFVALSIVDGATCFHQAKLLRTRDPEHLAQRFVGAVCVGPFSRREPQTLLFRGKNGIE